MKTLALVVCAVLALIVIASVWFLLTILGHGIRNREDVRKEHEGLRPVARR